MRKTLSFVFILLLWTTPSHAFNVAKLGLCGGTGDDQAGLRAAIAALPLDAGGEMVVPANRTCHLTQSLLVDRPLYIHGAGVSSVITGTADPLFATDELSEHHLEVERVSIVSEQGNPILRMRKITFSTGASAVFSHVWLSSPSCTGTLLVVEGGPLRIENSRVSGWPFCSPTNHLVALSLNQIGNAYVQGSELVDSWFAELGTMVQSRAEDWPLSAGLRVRGNTVFFVGTVLDMENHNSLLFVDNMVDQVDTPLKLTNVSPTQVAGTYFGSTNKNGDPLIVDTGFGDLLLSNNTFARYESPLGPAVMRQEPINLKESLNIYGGWITDPAIQQTTTNKRP